MEKIKTILLFIPMLLLVLTNCNKQEEPIPISGDPVFYLDATLDGEALLLGAGVNEYFLQSSEYEGHEQRAMVCWEIHKP